SKPTTAPTRTLRIAAPSPAARGKRHAREAEMLLGVGLQDGGRAAVAAAADELLVERNPLVTERAILGGGGGEIPARQGEDRLAVYLHRGPPPEAADADDLRAELLDHLDQEIQGEAARHEILDQQDARAGPDQALKLHGQGDPALAPRDALGAVDDDRPGGM